MANMRMKSITFLLVALNRCLIEVNVDGMPHFSDILELLNMRIEVLSELCYVYSFLIHGIAFPDGHGIVLG